MKKYCVQIPFGYLQAKSFRNFLDLCISEMEFWASFHLDDHTDFHNANRSQSWTIRQFRKWREMLSFWEQIVEQLKALDGRSFPSFFDELRVRIESSSDVPPHSRSHLATVISQNWNSDPKGARALIWAFVTSGLTDESREIQFGHSEAYYRGFAQSLFSSVLAQGKAITTPTESAVRDQKIIERVAQDLGVLSDEVASETVQRKAKVKKFEDYLTERVKKLHAKFLSDSNRLLNLQLKTHTHHFDNEEKAFNEREAKFENLKNLYEAQLRLKHPAKMWSDRQDTHEQNSADAWKKFRFGSLIFFVLVSTFVFFCGDWVASTFQKEGCKNGAEAACNSISAKGPLVIATILTIFTLVLWYLRLQMKIFLSERHLSLDARERSAFAETYLSLVQQQAISSNQEVVVLQSLFRPTQDGIINDDSGPDFAIAGVLARALERSK